MVKEWRTLSVDKEIYKLVKAKQNELIDKNDGHNVELSYVTEEAILRGIEKVHLNDHFDD